MRNESIQMHPSWKKVLEPEFQQDYMLKLKDFLKKEIAQGKIIYPKGSDYFHALNSTPFDKVRVVILGQDPYHGPDQAHGLSFSVKPGVPIPPSLVNIFKELKSDLGVPASHHGYLQYWAEQGVLLLNTVLTVEQGQAASHESSNASINSVLSGREKSSTHRSCCNPGGSNSPLACPKLRR